MKFTAEKLSEEAGARGSINLQQARHVVVPGEHGLLIKSKNRSLSPAGSQHLQATTKRF